MRYISEGKIEIDDKTLDRSTSKLTPWIQATKDAAFRKAKQKAAAPRKVVKNAIQLEPELVRAATLEKLEYERQVKRGMLFEGGIPQPDSILSESDAHRFLTTKMPATAELARRAAKREDDFEATIWKLSEDEKEAKRAVRRMTQQLRDKAVKDALWEAGEYEREKRRKAFAAAAGLRYPWEKK